MGRSDTACGSESHPIAFAAGNATAFVRRRSGCGEACGRWPGIAAEYDESLLPQSPTTPALTLPQLGGGDSCWCCRTVNSLPRAGGGLGGALHTRSLKLAASSLPFLH